ncbi:MAG: glycosyltransferase family 39 protein [Candidatus Micrarchaeota archaeon]|nr:glycosyltransferase family 39 protein [Candidatus Micrarchaeota archaeon]
MEKSTFAVFLFLLLLNVIIALSQPLAIFVDEGQYLLISKKMIEGWVPYRDIVENKPIGMYISLIPAVLLCGNDFVKLRLYGALIVGVTSFLVFLIGSKTTGRAAGLLAALIFICIAAFPSLYGYNLITEPVVNLFVVALFYVLLKEKLNSERALLIGILTAAACSVRQTSVFVFLPLAFAFLYYNGKTDKKRILLSFLAGGAVITIPILLYLTLNSALGDAFYWTFLHLIRLGGSDTESKLQTVGAYSLLFLPFVLASFLSLLELSKEKKVVWLWLLGSLILVQVGYAWSHNYILLAPPFSILAADGIAGAVRKGRNEFVKTFLRGVRIALFLTMLLVFLEFNIIRESKYYPSWQEQKQISDFIANHTNRSEGIFVFRNNAEIYYLSDREPVGRMSFFFGGYFEMMDEKELKEFVFGPLEEKKPRYFVFNAADFAAYRDFKNSNAVRDYMLENYVYVTGAGPLEVYERKY